MIVALPGITALLTPSMPIASAPECRTCDFSNSSTCAPETRSVPVLRSRAHELYTGGDRGHDLALLTLAEPADRPPVCLPERWTRQIYLAAGWGRLAGRPGSRRKLWTRATLAPRDRCRADLAAEGVGLAEDQFCAGGARGERSCVADSGGPLMGVSVQPDGSHRMAVYGLLTTDSRFCERRGWPNVYTAVLPYRDWILKGMAE